MLSRRTEDQMPRPVEQKLRNTNYFDITEDPVDEATAEKQLQKGKVQFIFKIPSLMADES